MANFENEPILMLKLALATGYTIDQKNDVPLAETEKKSSGNIQPGHFLVCRRSVTEITWSSNSLGLCGMFI